MKHYPNLSNLFQQNGFLPKIFSPCHILLVGSMNGYDDALPVLPGTPAKEIIGYNSFRAGIDAIPEYEHFCRICAGLFYIVDASGTPAIIICQEQFDAHAQKHFAVAITTETLSPDIIDCTGFACSRIVPTGSDTYELVPMHLKAVLSVLHYAADLVLVDCIDTDGNVVHLLVSHHPNSIYSQQQFIRQTMNWSVKNAPPIDFIKMTLMFSSALPNEDADTCGFCFVKQHYDIGSAKVTATLPILREDHHTIEITTFDHSLPVKFGATVSQFSLPDPDDDVDDDDDDDTPFGLRIHDMIVPNYDWDVCITPGLHLLCLHHADLDADKYLLVISNPQEDASGHSFFTLLSSQTQHQTEKPFITVAVNENLGSLYVGKKSALTVTGIVPTGPDTYEQRPITCNKIFEVIDFALNVKLVQAYSDELGEFYMFVLVP